MEEYYLLDTANIKKKHFPMCNETDMLFVMSCGRFFVVCADNVNCVTPFGFAVTGKRALIIDCISHPVLKEH